MKHVRGPSYTDLTKFSRKSAFSDVFDYYLQSRNAIHAFLLISRWTFLRFSCALDLSETSNAEYAAISAKTMWMQHFLFRNNALLKFCNIETPLSREISFDICSITRMRIAQLNVDSILSKETFERWIYNVNPTNERRRLENVAIL